MDYTWNSTSHHEYDVSGETLEDVVAAIEGMDEAGRAEWWPSWEYDTDENGEITEVRFTVDSAITLPRWVDESSASGPEQQEWRRFLQALSEHEDGHLERVRNFLDGTDERLLHGDPSNASENFDWIVNELQESSNLYDSETDHGRNTGTIVDLDVVPSSESAESSDW